MARKRVTGGYQASRVSNAAVTEAQVRSIRKLLEEGASARELSEIHQLSVETIRRIGRRETWAWIEDEIPMPLVETLPPLGAGEKKEADEILQRLMSKYGTKG